VLELPPDPAAAADVVAALLAAGAGAGAGEGGGGDNDDDDNDNDDDNNNNNENNNPNGGGGGGAKGHDHHRMPGIVPLLSLQTASGRALAAGALLGALFATALHLYCLWDAAGLAAAGWRAGPGPLVAGMWGWAWKTGGGVASVGQAA
jgi:hypothetical protein